MFRFQPESRTQISRVLGVNYFGFRPEGEVNDQDHRAGGTTRVIVDKPRTPNEAHDVEKPKT
jgi:hypothetical protein